MNAMVDIRGNANDYDEWAAAGAAGWGYRDVLPYFIRSEDNERGGDEHHRVGGPQHVCDGRAMSRPVELFLESAAEAGYQANPDFNGASQLGVGRYQLTQHNGMRWSTADGYLRPALARPNLTVITGALAHRVAFYGDRAIGVEISSGAERSVVRAQCEVVLSAGSYGSPHLLLLSGVGPTADLSPFGIPIVAYLPVGHGLQDHMLCAINYLTDEESLTTAARPANAATLQERGQGPLTSNIDEAGGFLQTRAGLSGPDVQLHSTPVIFFDEGFGAPPAHGTAIAVGTVSPENRGQVRLRSASPDAAPRIQHNYLQDDGDRQSMVAGLRAAMKIVHQAPLRAIITGSFDAPPSDSDADLTAHDRQKAHTQYHPTSTCAIGSVVDPELRVLGLDGLRVVDASVMQKVVRGNTNAPTMMIAEKAADLITAAQT
jgi:choline dehydrogenase